MVKKVKKIVKKQPPKKRIPTQRQSQNVNVYYGTKQTKRGKRKTQIRQPINYQLTPPPIYNIYQSQPSLIPPPVAATPTPEIRTPSLIPSPIESPRVSLPIRAGLAVGSAVGSGIGSAILSTGSVVLSSIFWPPDAERPAVERPAITPVVPFPVGEEPPAFANIEPVFAEPPFPLVPYQPPLQPPDDEFFDLPEDPFNIEQPFENPFVAPEVAAPEVAAPAVAAPAVAAPAVAAPEVEEESEYLPYDPAQFEDLRQLTAAYSRAEQPTLLLQPPINEPFGSPVVEINDPFSAPVVAAKPQKKKFPKKLSAAEEEPQLTVKQYLAKQRRAEEAEGKKEAKRREKGKDIRGLFPVEAQPIIIGQALFEEPQKEELPFGLEVIQRATPEKQKGGLERVRPEEEEQPLQYGFSN